MLIESQAFWAQASYTPQASEILILNFAPTRVLVEYALYIV